jgi:hypothetical protein
MLTVLCPAAQAASMRPYATTAKVELSVISMSFFYQSLHLGVLHYLQMECSVHSMQEESQAVFFGEKARSPESYSH